MNLPRARTDDLLTTQLEDEVVVYDPARKQAHSLNRTALAVWNHSDGQTSVSELQRRVSEDVGAPVSEAAVWLALRKLERAHLLTERLASTEPITRRHLLGQAGKFGAAAMLVTPIVVSAGVPAAALACSSCGTGPAPTGTDKCVCGAHITACSVSGSPTTLPVCYDNLVTTTSTAGTGGACHTDADCIGAPASLCIIDGANTCNGTCHPAPCTLLPGTCGVC